MFASLTVEENLALCVPAGPRPQGGARRTGAGLRGVPAGWASGGRQSAGTLSGGEQRMLALARVLVLEEKLLVVDELSFGLAPVVVDEVYAALEQVLAAGTSLLLIEQHVDRALVLADDVVVLARAGWSTTARVAGVEGRIGDLVLGRRTRRGRTRSTDRVRRGRVGRGRWSGGRTG